MQPHEERVVIEQKELSERLSKLRAFAERPVVYVFMPNMRSALGRWRKFIGFKSDIACEKPRTFFIHNAGISMRLASGKLICASSYYVENWP